MNKITFPLEVGNQSPAVGDLQEALLVFLERRLILPDDEAARSELSVGLQAERANLTYRDITAKVVSFFQRQFQLEDHGRVDERTARSINALLQELGLLTQPSEERSRVVSGQVRREDGGPIKDSLVRAFHDSESGPIRLGEDETDREGRYTIRYELLPGITSVNLRVEAEGHSSDVIRSANPLQIIDFLLPVTIRPSKQQRLEGRVVFDNGLPAQDLALRLYRVDFGGAETRVSETTTIELGVYALPFDLGAKAAGLEVRGVDAAGNELRLSKPLHDLGEEKRIIVNLIAPAALRPMTPEYRRLSADLTQHVGEMRLLAGAHENAERQDLTVLNRATGWDARLIALAANAEKLNADPDVQLPQEAVYGLLRAGLPSDKLQLAQVNSKVVEQTLKKVRDAGIVSLTDEQMTEIKTRFDTFANQTRLAIRAPGSRSTYGELLENSGLNPATQAKFANAFLNHRGDADQLWKSATDAGLNDLEIQTLQLQGKLAFLTGNSSKLTKRLQHSQGVRTPEELAEKDFYLASKWESEIREAAQVRPEVALDQLSDAEKQQLRSVIPSSFEVENIAEGLKAYSDDMARKVRLSYPTQVVRRMVEQDVTDRLKLGPARVATATFLKNAAPAGFKLGQTPVEAFVKANSAVVNSIEGLEVAKKNVKTLQRIYQITPSDNSMTVLMELGLTSAYDVVTLSMHNFIDRYGKKFPGGATEAELIYRKAQQVTSVTYNLFTIAKKLDSEAPISVISGTQQQYEEAKKGLKETLKDYPTMESLFGSMDFCECEHCRSVLSPAAYLVDLLQFLDAEPELWDNFLAHWKEVHGGQDYSARYKKPYDALIERRPDIPYIALTCANTHTALPYIDIVNEILEYFVAREELTSDAAHDTGDSTTAELLAEPQNVVAEAYDKLHRVSYPLNLPFDLWIETVRQFCDYFDAPLWQVLETFRRGDELVAPLQPYDRANVFIESLRLSPAEYAVFIDPTPLKDNKWQELYGYPASLNAPAILKSAKLLSRRLGVTYKEITEIVKTGFVNPKLSTLVILYKLGVTVHDVMFYKAHRGLLAQDVTTLSTEDLKRLEEIRAFEQRLKQLNETYASSGFRADTWINTALEENLFDDVLVLSDPDASCNFDLTTLQYANGNPADAIAFLKINLFVRLWRKLGWTIEETDRALQVFVPKNAPFDADPGHLNQQPFKTALIYLAHFKTLDQQLRGGKQGRFKLLTLWSDLATTGSNPLYGQLFLTRSLLKSDDAFDDPLGQYLSPISLAAKAQSRKHEVTLNNVSPVDRIDPSVFAGNLKISVNYDPLQRVQHLSYQGVLTEIEQAALLALSPSAALAPLLDDVQAKASNFVQTFPLIKEHVLALQGALGLTAGDIAQILGDSGLSDDTAALSLANVSVLYRYGLLANTLKLTIRELIALKQISGLDPFRALHADPLESLSEDHPFSDTMLFVEVAGHIKDAGLKIEDLDYMLRHRFDETGKYRPNNEANLQLIKTLAEGIRAIRTEHAVPANLDSISDEMLRLKLGLVLPPDSVKRFLALMNGTFEFTAAKPGVPPEAKLNPDAFRDEPAIRDVSYNDKDPRRIQKLTFRGLLFPPEKDRLKALFSSTVFADLLDDLENQAKQERSFFDNHLKKQRLRLDGEAGFLDESDFKTLFESLKPLLKMEPGDNQTQIDDKLKENEKIRQENQATLQKRRARVAETFFPFLQQQLIRQFIVQTISAHLAADPVLVEPLLCDAGLLGDPKPLIEAFTSERGLRATFFDGAGAALGNRHFPDADTGHPLKPAGAASARFDGYLEVPIPGVYRFYISFDKKDAEAELRFDHLSGIFLSGKAQTDDDDKLSEYLELKSGMYRFTLNVKKLNGGEVRLLIQGEKTPKDKLAQLPLYSLTYVERSDRAMILLGKALQLIATFGLTEREVRYLLTHPGDFDGLSLSELAVRDAQLELETIAEKRRETDPQITRGQAIFQARNENPELAADADQVTTLFRWLIRLTGYWRLKRDLAPETDDLIRIFETPDLEQAYSVIARLTRRDESTVRMTAQALFASPSFRNEVTVQRLWDALQIVERFGVPATAIVSWTRICNSSVTPHQRFAIARDLKEAIKARFEPETWQRIAQPIFDKLRQRQRDSLATHVMHQHGFDRMEQLYEYFLMDPGMEPVVQTSRIRLAIASVQLFIQRSLLNLEKRVHPAVINARQWEWMKRYRVWEANRKIFLFPENWLEPEFRDDKTHLFSELEGTLLQGDVSSDLVEDAFLNYLKKLEELACLDLVGMHIEDNSDPALRKLHVIGRTYSEPAKYFYRRYAHEEWTPWEPVTAEIQGNHLAPVVWRNRLYLFWVTFMEKAEQPVGSAYKLSQLGIAKHANLATASVSGSLTPVDMYLATSEEPKLTDLTLSEVTGGVVNSAGRKTIEAQLHWSEYLNGEWSSRESGGVSSPSPIFVTGVSNFNDSTVFVHVSKEPYENGEERGVFIHLSNPINQAFYLAGRNVSPEKAGYQRAPANPYTSATSVRANRYSGTGALKVGFTQRITTEDGKGPVQSPKETPNILEQGGTYTLLPCDNNITLGGTDKATNNSLEEIASLIKPIFYQDNAHTFFIEPNVEERTIEEWKEWVTRTPQPEPDGIPDPRWKDFVKPMIPTPKLRMPIDPGDPIWNSPLERDSLFKVQPGQDWLVNPSTGLHFDSEIIGPAGRAGLVVVQPNELAGAIAEGGVPVRVHDGSNLVSGLTVVAKEHDGLDSAGVDSTVGMLNVIGSSGFNSSLAQNFNAINRPAVRGGR